jgi:hypothetical protein
MCKPQIGTAQVPKPPDEEAKARGWTVMRASAVAVARERAGCPLETLACRFSEQKLEVLIGSLDTLPKRPK